MRSEIKRHAKPKQAVGGANHLEVARAGIEHLRCGIQHEVPLSAQALAIIERIPRRNSSATLFTENGTFGNWAKAKTALDQRVGIAPWRLHDLRRTAATQMAEIGVLPHVIEQALNHVSGAKAGVAGIYNRSKMTDAVREGLQRWANHLDQITA